LRRYQYEATKKEYFDLIKAGKKKEDFRDAHLTLECEETGEKIVKEVVGVEIIDFSQLPKNLKKTALFGDSKIIKFKLR
jgi:ASC-1-like (ASCH) protein